MAGERFLVSLDIEKLESEERRGLGYKQLCYLDRVQAKVTNETVECALRVIPKHTAHFTVYVDAITLDKLDDIISLLNCGAQRVFVTWEQIKLIKEQNLLEDLGRLIVSYDHQACTGIPQEQTLKIRDQIRWLDPSGDYDIGVHVHDAHEGNLLESMWRCSALGGFPPRYVSMTTNSWPKYLSTVAYGYIPIVPAADLTLDAEKDHDLIPAETLVTTAIVSDRADGLYPTVVVDENNICLGLVYSSEKSVTAALQRGQGIYQSRKREGLWVKGETSGDTQELLSVGWDCDGDALIFKVRQKGKGFCHLKTATCFGPYLGLAKLEKTLQARKKSAPPESYTAKLFEKPKLLGAKILEEANELIDAQTHGEIAAEAADLIYFAMVKCVAAGVSLADIEHNLDMKSLKVSRRPGLAKPQYSEHLGLDPEDVGKRADKLETVQASSDSQKAPVINETPSTTSNDVCIRMRRYDTTKIDEQTLKGVLQRPSQKSTDQILDIVKPIIENVRTGGDKAVLEYTHKFEKAITLTSPVLKAPFPPELMKLDAATISAIDISFENIRKFHSAQRESGPLRVETMPGVVCSRFSRPIESVGCYVPGGTAVLPSTALMLGVPAMVAGCKHIILASPPRADGTPTPEVVYVAHKVGAEAIVLAGGAQAVAAMAYGTESIRKVDKILGPGNQFVTAAKMFVSTDTSACVSIDMPAGPSEVLVIADATANPAFVASDLLSQAEHGKDSQVVLIAIALSDTQLAAIDDALHEQAMALPRKEIVQAAIEHSVTLVVESKEEAFRWSNIYAPEHLILQMDRAEDLVELVESAGSVFVGHWTPESVGDYSAGVNHSLRMFRPSSTSPYPLFCSWVGFSSWE
jgi:phosphoribosyl-ATP pyrophosphohydrolase/phosphoribosyl-AMP cyclohydrolase/histidinol dehydrogenase